MQESNEFIMGCGCLFVALLINFFPAASVYVMTKKDVEPKNAVMVLFVWTCEIIILSVAIYEGLR